RVVKQAMQSTEGRLFQFPIAPLKLRGRLAPAGKLAVKFFVALRGRRPGEISRRRALHQFSPQLAIAKNLPRTLDRIPKGRGGIFVTEKAVATVGGWIVVLDDFLDAAGRARHRKRAVFQTVHRTQPGRLE